MLTPSTSEDRPFHLSCFKEFGLFCGPFILSPFEHWGHRVQCARNCRFSSNILPCRVISRVVRYGS